MIIIIYPHLINQYKKNKPFEKTFSLDSLEKLKENDLD